MKGSVHVPYALIGGTTVYVQLKVIVIENSFFKVDVSS